jgi:hypothetical protein
VANEEDDEEVEDVCAEGVEAIDRLVLREA